ncbi:hypothetical protein [Dysgonomonas reticulitermitis]
MKRVDNLLDSIVANRKSHIWLFLFVLLVLSLLMMYFYNPLHPGQDFFFHYRRLQALMDGIKSPYLMYLDYGTMNGYGYFTKAFYPDLTLIPFALIGNFTNIEFAYLSMIFVMTFLCGLFTYITVNKIYKNSFTASIAAILYTFCFYRLLDIYHRAAVGEAITFTFLPLVLLGLYHIIKGDYKKWYILTVGFSLMIFTHLISSVLMFITIIIILLIYCKSLFNEPKRFYYLLLSGVATFLIVSYYIFPLLEQMTSNVFYYESRNLTVRAQDSVFKINWIIWGLFSGVVQAKQIFIPGTGLILTCGILLRLFVYGKSKELRSIDILVILGLAYIFTTWSLFPWSLFPFNKLNFIQLPWRLLEFSSFFFAIAGGYYLSHSIKSKKRLFVAGCVIVLATIFVMINDAKLYKEIRSGKLITEDASVDDRYHMGGIEYVPDKVPDIEYIRERGDTVIAGQQGVGLSGVNRMNGVTGFSVVTTSKTTIELPLIYYKGYAATIDAKSISVEESSHGLVQIPVDKSGSVKVYYKGTIVQKVSWYITIVSIFVLCIYIFVQKKRKQS